ncbi:hypothetical protein JCM10212_005464 [Sporobolomyces blumeae]
MEHLPSRDLPGLNPFPRLATVLEHLDLLSTRLNPTDRTIDLRVPLAVSTGTSSSIELETGSVGAQGLISISSMNLDDDRDGDEFETRFARSWVERVVQGAVRALGRGTDDEEWARVVEVGSGLVARLAGPSASGNGSTTYILPVPQLVPDPTSTFASTSNSNLTLTDDDTISIRIHDGTLVSCTTGHRTWGSAPLLAQLLFDWPAHYFPFLSRLLPTPPPPPPDCRGRRPSETPPSNPEYRRVERERVGNERSLTKTRPPRVNRILELGSGTGLVGISTYALFDDLARGRGSVVDLGLEHAAASSVAAALDDDDRVQIVLSDGGEANDEGSSSVLDNLRSNVEAKTEQREPRTEVQIEVTQLRWDDYLPLVQPSRSSPEQRREPLFGDEDVARRRRARDPNSNRRRPDEVRDQFDVILGADLVYEPEQARSLHACVFALLRLPDDGDDDHDSDADNDDDSPDRGARDGSGPRTRDDEGGRAGRGGRRGGTFHLVFPVRRTHAVEADLVDHYFPAWTDRSDSSRPHSSEASPCTPSIRKPRHEGPDEDDEKEVESDRAGDGRPESTTREYKLFAVERRDVVAPDGFGRPPARRRGTGRGTSSGDVDRGDEEAKRGGSERRDGMIEYRRYRIEWREV